MIRLTFEPEPALRSARRLSRRMPVLPHLARGLCVGFSLSVPYLMFLLQTHAH